MFYVSIIKKFAATKPISHKECEPYVAASTECSLLLKPVDAYDFSHIKMYRINTVFSLKTEYYPTRWILL